jgi:predicted DNA-binding transcriptional regulator AlpA
MPRLPREQRSPYPCVTNDELVPDPQVWREFGISSMTGYRWDHDTSLDFPPPIKIRNRNFRSRRAIEAFKQRMLGEAVRRRSGSSREAATA